MLLAVLRSRICVPVRRVPVFLLSPVYLHFPIASDLVVCDVEDVCAAYFGAVGDVFDESISGVKVFLAVWAFVAL